MGFVEFRVNTLDPIPFLETYLDEDETPYPLFNALMRALEIPVTYDAGLGSALGFLADGATRFNLSLERGTVLVGETLYTVQPGDLKVLDQKLYIHYQAAARWLPLKMQWNTQGYLLIARTDYLPPSEEKQRRETRRNELKAYQSNNFDPGDVERDVPWFDPGMFEVSTSASGGQGYPDGGRVTLKGVHRVLKGDLEYSLTQSHFDGETRDPTVDYSRLTHYDPLRTWQTQLGDTFATFTPLVVGTQSFRGASFYTGGRRLRFGRTTLIGTAPPGSEVDLYRLGVLVDFTTVDDRGFYRFENVPLAFRTTRFEARIFTPGGRQISDFHDISSQEEMLAAGNLASVGAAGQGEQAEGSFTINGAEARYGVTDWLTLGAYVIGLQDYAVSFDFIEKQTSAGGFLLIRPMEWLVLLAEQAEAGETEGTGQRVSAFVALGAFSLEVEQQTYTLDYAPPRRIRSIAFATPARALTSTRVAAHTRIFATNIGLTGITTDFGNTRLTSTREIRLDRRITQRISLSLNQRSELSTEDNLPDSGMTTLEALGSYSLGSLSRVELLTRNAEVIGAESSSQYRLTWLKNHRADSPWSYRISHTNYSDREGFSQAQLGYQFANNLRITGDVDSEQRWLIQASYSLPFRISGEGFEAYEATDFGRAGVTGHVYVDANGNGVRDGGEPPMPDVSLLAPGVGDIASDKSGRFNGWGLPTHTPSNLEVDLLSTDALYQPSRKRIPIAPRPGEVIEVDIALVPGGGLEGRLTAPTIRGTSPANGLEMLLSQSNGDIIARARVEFDGSFLFESVPPGVYRVYGNPDEMKRRGLSTLPAERHVTFPASTEPVWIVLRAMTLVRDTGR